MIRPSMGTVRQEDCEFEGNFGYVDLRGKMVQLLLASL